MARVRGLAGTTPMMPHGRQGVRSSAPQSREGAGPGIIGGGFPSHCRPQGQSAASGVWGLVVLRLLPPRLPRGEKPR